jgi:ribose 5-phosphate isomerase B
MSSKRKIAIGCDHAAFDAKTDIIAVLKKNPLVEVVDCGPFDKERVDYPDYAQKVCSLINAKEVECGILFCGTGIGISIAANKISGIRAALCHDHFTAKMARMHNDANVVCCGARVLGPEVIAEIVETFLATPFEGGRHADRVGKIMALEKASALTIVDQLMT